MAGCARDIEFHWWVACSSEIGADPSRNPELAAVPNNDGWNDGLLYYDPRYADNGNQQIYPTKRFYAMGNFSRYVRPGFQRYDVLGAARNLRIVAFAAAPDPAAPRANAQSAPVQVPGTRSAGSGRDWVAVVINNAPTTEHVQVQFPGTSRLIPVTAVETSAIRNLEPVELPTINARGLLTASVPGQSITTFVLSGQSFG